MNLMHLDRWDWDPELLAATAPDLADKLPTIHPGTTNTGFLAEYFVSKFGFSPKTPITIFTGDNPSSLVGMGAAEPGTVVLSLGTSDTFFAAMPEFVADPEGCGHVFGNPLGGSMSLQCFVNGSLAREAVKNKFSYDWDQFSDALNQTPAGNKGQLMLPFFRPEISPPIELDKPKLKGNSQAFENWEQPDAAIRACIEGQFINMKLRSDWMQLSPEVIYLTGGASQNDAIAQVVADIFQCKVQRLSVSGSVALGGALRAAVQSLECSTKSLKAEFCKVDSVHVFNPQVSADCYTDAFISFEKLLKQSL
jgi:xylulokinase